MTEFRGNLYVGQTATDAAVVNKRLMAIWLEANLGPGVGPRCQCRSDLKVARLRPTGLVFHYKSTSSMWKVTFVS